MRSKKSEISDQIIGDVAGFLVRGQGGGSEEIHDPGSRPPCGMNRTFEH